MFKAMLILIPFTCSAMEPMDIDRKPFRQSPNSAFTARKRIVIEQTPHPTNDLPSMMGKRKYDEINDEVHILNLPTRASLDLYEDCIKGDKTIIEMFKENNDRMMNLIEQKRKFLRANHELSLLGIN